MGGLAVKLMLKWPNLYYSTSAFAPKHYPKAIIDYANTRGADKVIYAGYFPMGLSLDRIMSDMQNVPFKDEVWPKFLRENAMRCSDSNHPKGAQVCSPCKARPWETTRDEPGTSGVRSWLNHDRQNPCGNRCPHRARGGLADPRKAQRRRT